MNREFWTIGECMLELRDDAGDTLATTAAGDTYNTAVYFKRLLPAVTVRYVSALGQDTVSRRIRRHMRDHEVDDTLVASLPQRLPGLYLIENDPDGDRHFRYWRQHSAARAMLDAAHLRQVQEALPACGGLLLTGISLAILDRERRETLLDLAQEVVRRGGWVIVDNNYRPALWPADEASHWLGRALKLCTHALLSFDDEAALHADADPMATIARLRAGRNSAEIVLKLGAAGCLVAQSGRAVTQIAALAVRAVDTTAAGDSFNAAYLAARWSGLAPLAAAEHGCLLAARVVAHAGAIIQPAAMEDLVCSLED